MLFCLIKCMLAESFFKVSKSMIFFSLKNATDTLLPNRYPRIIVPFPCSSINDKKTVTS